MINGSDHTKPIDDGLTCIITNLRDLGKNLMLAIENQIKDDKLMNLCLAINDDISLTITRYDELKKKKKPRPFRSALLDEEDFEFEDTKVTAKVNNNNQKVTNSNNNNLINIFDDIGVSNSGGNVNQTSRNVQSNVGGGDIFDIISGMGNVSTGNAKVNNVNNNQNQNVNNNNNFPFDNNNVNSNPVQSKPEEKKTNINDLLNSLYANEYSGNANTGNTGNKDPFANVYNF
jgi:hypothetical protein